MADLDYAASKIRRALKSLDDARDVIDRLAHGPGAELKPYLHDAAREIEAAKRGLMSALSEIG